MRQGASGHVRLVQRGRRTLVEKRLPDPLGHDTEALALRTLAGSGLPVPELVEIAPGSILMTRMPGERLDEVHPDVRLAGLRASAALLRRLHGIEPPAELPAAPDDARTIRRYVDAGGPPLPLTIPPATPAVFCHGDWGRRGIRRRSGCAAAVGAHPRRQALAVVRRDGSSRVPRPADRRAARLARRLSAARSPSKRTRRERCARARAVAPWDHRSVRLSRPSRSRAGAACGGCARGRPRRP